MSSDIVDHGRCGVCGHVGDYLDEGRPLRENHRCRQCRATLRYRLQARTICAVFGSADCSLVDLAGRGVFDDKAIYEPGIIGPFRRVFARVSEYVTSGYWPDVAPGDDRDGVRCEDLERLTFSDESFDLVISSDIFEHVRRPYTAFAEIHRVLRAGGWHVFTVPLRWPPRPQDAPRVDTTTSEDVFLVEPRYHSSPTDPAGALVYTDFGMDLPENLRVIGFDTLTHHGYRQAMTFASRKPRNDDQPQASDASPDVVSAAATRRRGWRRR